MSDEHLGLLVKQYVVRSEPMLLTTAEDVALASRRARLRGRIVMGASATVVAAIALAGGALVSSEPGRGGSDVADASQFSADSYASTFVQVVQAVAGRTSFTEPEVRAFDSQDNPIEGADRDKATVWRGTFQRSADHFLQVYAIHSESENEGQATAECDGALKTELLTSCVVTSRDGAVLVFSEGTVRRMGETWPAWNGSEGIPGADPDVWFMHRVTATEGDLQVAAFEVVRADSAAAARSLWELDEETLAALVTHESFGFPSPPAGRSGCGWVVPEKAELYSC